MQTTSYNYVYIARLASDGSDGIRNKLVDTVKAIQSLGRVCDLKIVSTKGISSVLQFVKSVIIAKHKVLIIRSDHYSLIFLMPFLYYKRLAGHIIIFDIPNPISASYRETVARNGAFFKKVSLLSILLISYPISLFPAHRIFSYGKDSWFVNLGVKSKLKIVGNGIDTEKIVFIERGPQFDGTEVIFGMAGHIAFYHGVDRFIKSLAAYNKTEASLRCRIKLKIIGSGFEIDRLKSQVSDLKLERDVHFAQRVKQEELVNFFENVHLGLCNLAQHRKAVFMISDLKSRDMAARGIPFVLAAQDPDISGARLKCVYSIPNDESLLDLEGIVNWFSKLTLLDRYKLRKFAVDSLDYKVKMKSLIDFCEGSKK